MRLPPISPAGWGHPALRGNTNHCAVGAGYAPPAVLRLQQHNGSFVGAAYMPPVAAIPAIQPNGKNARDAYMRPLQTRRKYRTITGLCGNSNHCLVGAGQAPPAVLRQLRYCGLVCRGGTHAARCSLPDISPSSGAFRATFPHRGKACRNKKCAAPSGRHAVVISCFSTAPLPRRSAPAIRRGPARRPGPHRRCSRGAGH